MTLIEILQARSPELTIRNPRQQAEAYRIDAERLRSEGREWDADRSLMISRLILLCDDQERMLAEPHPSECGAS